MAISPRFAMRILRKLFMGGNPWLAGPIPRR
jgi:hypothetical protein